MSEALHLFDAELNFSHRTNKEQITKQHAKSFWLIGLSGSGKSTIASILERKLEEKNFLVKILDGDNIRLKINKDLGFGIMDRMENVRRTAEIANLFTQAGVITINCLIAPTESIRNLALEILGIDYVEIYIDTPLQECIQRDVKGLYQKALNGEIKNFTGINAPFEIPKNPFYSLKTSQIAPEESAQELLTQILPLIIY